MGLQNVVVATDLSSESVAAVRAAVRSVVGAGDRLTLLTVVEVWPLPEWPYTPGMEVEERLREAAASRLHQLAVEDFSPYRVTEVVRSSLNVPEEICAVARAGNHDAIITGSHGAGAVANLFIGGTVQRVIKLAPCLVIVAPRSFR
jgi:nucleotide-binding universal stress UspA family protein